jgi:ubiquitin-conjugating enzyme E2 J1
MDVPAKGQVGGIESDAATRRRLAEGSRGFVCATCGRSNTEILQEQAELAKANEGEGVVKKEEEKIPEELKLVYKDDLKAAQAGDASKPTSVDASKPDAPSAPSTSQNSTATTSKAPPAQALTQAPLRPPQGPRHNNDDTRLDAAIWVISGLLIILVVRMFIRLIL